MAKVNGKYETIFIVNPNLGEEAITAIVEKFKALIADNGTVVSVDDWGKRRMAYEINDLREGYYTLIEFESLPSGSCLQDHRWRYAFHHRLQRLRIGDRIC